jgi:hypothetical protein
LEKVKKKPRVTDQHNNSWICISAWAKKKLPSMTSRYLLPFFHQYHVTVRSLSVSLYNRPTKLFFKEVWTLKLREILKLCPWKWKYDREFTKHNMNEWTLNSCFVYVDYIDVFFPHSNDMTSWQNSSAEKISCNVAPLFYHYSVVIQYLVSDRLLSLISKENIQNVRKMSVFHRLICNNMK